MMDVIYGTIDRKLKLFYLRSSDAQKAVPGRKADDDWCLLAYQGIL